EATANLYSNKFLSDLAKILRKQIKELLGGSLNKAFIPFIEAFLWVIILLLFDFILQKIFGKIFGLIAKHSRFNWVKQFYQHKVFRTLIHFITVSILISINPYVFQKYHGIDKFTE